MSECAQSLPLLLTATSIQSLKPPVLNPAGSFPSNTTVRTGQLKYDGTRAETRFRLSAKRTNTLTRQGRQFSRLLAAEVCASPVVMLDTPSSEVV
jgi:hypothetical protein